MFKRYGQWYDENPIGGFLSVIAAVLVISSVAWVTCSHFESQAFTRVTGRNVSTWDAMWIELRVDNPPL